MIPIGVIHSRKKCKKGVIMLIEIKNRIWWICDCILELRLIPYQEWRFEEAMSDIGKHYRNKR